MDAACVDLSAVQDDSGSREILADYDSACSQIEIRRTPKPYWKKPLSKHYDEGGPGRADGRYPQDFRLVQSNEIEWHITTRRGVPQIDRQGAASHEIHPLDLVVLIPRVDGYRSERIDFF